MFVTTDKEISTFINNNLRNFCKNKNMVKEIYKEIMEITKISSENKYNDKLILDIIKKYLFKDKSTTNNKEFLSIKEYIEEWSNLNPLYYFNYEKSLHNNIFNTLLSSPYLDNLEKIELFKELNKNIYYINDSGKKELEFPFLLNTTNPNIYFENFIKKEFADNSIVYKKYLLTDYFDVDFFIETIVENKDINTINNVIENINVFKDKIIKNSNNKSNLKPYIKVMSNIIKGILRNQYIVENLNLDSLEKIKDFITNNEILTNDEKIELNFCYYLYNDCHKKSNLFSFGEKKENVSENITSILLDSKEAINNKIINKFLTDNIDIPNLEWIQKDLICDIQFINKTTHKLNELINMNFDTELMKDSDCTYNKFISFLNIYSDKIININNDLYSYAYKIFDIKEVEKSIESKIETPIKLSFAKEFDDEDIIYLTYSLIEEAMNTEDRLERVNYINSCNEISCFIKNPFLMLFLYENKDNFTTKTLKLNSDFIKENLSDDLFTSLFETLNYFIEKESFLSEEVLNNEINENILPSISYEGKNLNLLKLEDNTINRSFLVEYITNIIKSEFLNEIKEDTVKLNDSYLYCFKFLINHFGHLEKEFPKIIEQIFKDINIEKMYIDKNSSSLSLFFENNKYQKKSILSSSKDFYDTLSENYSISMLKEIIKLDLKDEKVIDKIKSNKLNFSF